MSDNPLEHSIVHEYNILYSNRIHQKEKKWSDGVLRFYEFNSKLEISNEDGIIITTDFVRNKPTKYILEKILAEENEFKLPNNKLIILINEKLSVHERDISKALVKQEEPVRVIKLERTQRPLRTLDSGALNGTTQRRRRIGLRKVIKKEPGQSMTQMPSETPIKIENALTIMMPSLDEHKAPPIPQVAPKKMKQMVPKLYLNVPHVRQRIPPMSSKHFRYLHQVGSHVNTQQSTAGKHDNIEDQCNLKRNAVVKSDTIPNNECTNVKIKQEDSPQKSLLQSPKSLEEAEIIYDLSDFEEDEKFISMIQQLRKSKETTRISTQTQETQSRTQTALDKASLPNRISSLSGKKYNEAHEFDLSTYSDFDDVDS
ncbi:uncharacterized protein RJT20DRAFT_130569 [Scheffersomyces xylosifermentans]|uniref:uncharacterized protein n=1 Tax=Scheffersomyces xylosifermentans TaxID=1304137 RepID=UPI00315CD24E